MQSLRLCFLSVFLLFLSARSWAQIIQSQYIETEVTDKTGEEFRLFPICEKGLILAQELPLEGKKKQIVVECLDTILQSRWTQRVSVPQSTFYINYYLASKHLFIIASGEKHEFEVFRISLEDGYLTNDKIIDYKKLELTHFAAEDSIVIFGGIMYEKPVLLLRNLITKKTAAPAMLTKIEANITHIHIDTSHQQIWTVLRSNQKASKDNLYINRFSFSGELKEKFFIEKSLFYQPVQYRFLSLADSSLVILGSYAHRGESLVQGLFFWRLSEQKIKIERYFDFAFFDNYFRQLSDKKRKKITEKATSKRREGKFYPIKQRIMLHDLFMSTEGTIMCLAESYMGLPSSSATPLFPYYYYNRRADAYGRSYMPSIVEPPSTRGFAPPFLTRPDHGYERENWAEYRYEHSMVACFSQSGKKLWDNSLVFSKLSNNQPVELSSSLLVGDSLLAIYSDGSEVGYKFSDPVKYSDHINFIGLTNDEIIVDSHLNGGMRYWYGKNFLHCGIREIREVGQSIFKSKRYFYVSKLSVYQR